MINPQLFHPASIAVVGASNSLAKPGGKLFHNIKTGTFGGELLAVNPKEDEIQGNPSFRDVRDLPRVDLAILAVPASLCLEAVHCLAAEKGAKAIVIVSAGFGEENEEGGRIEREIVSICDAYEVTLIGPNCIGVMTPAFQGVFTLPIPRLDPGGVDFISGSGATAVFIMESGLQKGLGFNHVFSVGNSAQVGVEDVLAYLDETYEEGSSSKVKILYFESIKDPARLLVHASSLVRKGCRIAAVKAGTTNAGSRAATSHTGALASSDLAVDVLFRKAGIVRCYGREELTTLAGIMLYPPLSGKHIAIITHAGGPAVMLTDILARGGMEVPVLDGPEADRLLGHLFPGSSASNPIDILATGNAEQVGICIDFCETVFHEIDGIVVIFGTPGLAPVFDVYKVLHEKMGLCVKPIFPVLPSVTTAAAEVGEFVSRGHVFFQDEVILGQALTRLWNTPSPPVAEEKPAGMDLEEIGRIVAHAKEGYLGPEEVGRILDTAGIPRVPERIVHDIGDLEIQATGLEFPLAMKVIGPLHKSDVGGVVLGIEDTGSLQSNFKKLRKIRGFEGALLQPMVEGMELFAGAKFEPGFGHVVLCGPGGIFVEVMNDISAGLAPFTKKEALLMIGSLKSYPMLKGLRGKEGIDPESFADLLSRLSAMLAASPVIAELDLNPIIGKGKNLLVTDARIRIGK